MLELYIIRYESQSNATTAAFIVCYILSQLKIPYEKQEAEYAMRRCGAAALSMVLRSFALETNQEQIWNEAQNKGRIETVNLARLAGRFGIDAIVGRLVEPWKFLLNLDDNRRFILNHRIRKDSPLGHFSVFVGFSNDEKSVIVHDPQLGPNQEISRADLYELWMPQKIPSEITGLVGILFTNDPTDCDRIQCEKCGNPGNIPTQTENHFWSRIFCANCGSVLFNY